MEEGLGKSFAPLRINSGKLLIINLITTLIRFMTIIRAPEPGPEDKSADRKMPE